MIQKVLEKIERFPECPGVYIMKGANDKIFYIGKSNHLKKRVKSYFASNRDSRFFVSILETILFDIDVILCQNEKEALILENNLIKIHRPKYNVQLRDDKNFVTLRLDYHQKFPRLEIVRKIKTDGAKYFGPYTSATAIRQTLKIINQYFQLRTCSDAVLHNRSRPCLQYQIKRCLAPCVINEIEELYNKQIQSVIMFLEGKHEELLETLQFQMKEYSQLLEFEQATVLRDQIIAITESLKKQQVVSENQKNQDVWGFAQSQEVLQFHLIIVRAGKLVDSLSYQADHSVFPLPETFENVLYRYYESRDIPDEIIIPFSVHDFHVVKSFFEDKAQRKISLKNPSKGQGFQTLHIANSNALFQLESRLNEDEQMQTALRRIQIKLRLKNIPHYVECFDISLMQGEAAVGSQVVFVNGKPKKECYRKYNIRSPHEGNDDFLMMYEVLKRRLESGMKENNLPDLIILDGGKGQLSAVLRVFDELQIQTVDIVALAKARFQSESVQGKLHYSKERVFLPHVKDPVTIESGTQEFRLITSIRDEAHRFAITHHRKQREKRQIQREILQIPGLGRKREKLLLLHFGSMKKLKEAQYEELCSISGISSSLAKRIFEHIHSEKESLRL